MIDISRKYPGFRQAVAEARVYLPEEARRRVRENDIPKGDLISFCRAVAMLAAKKTPELLPFCHPILLDYLDLDGRMEEDDLVLTVTVRAVDRTGVEVEAMTAAAMAALNAYDMLKPVCEGVEIRGVRLREKRGGKTQFLRELATFDQPVGVAIIVLSDSVAAGRKEDRAGRAIEEALAAYPARVVSYEVMPDDPDRLVQRVRELVDHSGIRLIITSGGTGIGPRDRTVQALEPLLDRKLVGIGEWVRRYGGMRTPLAVLSNALCGLIGTTLVLCLPGSSRGARESMDSLDPWFFHLFKVIEKGYRHEGVDND